MSTLRETPLPFPVGAPVAALRAKAATAHAGHATYRRMSRTARHVPCDECVLYLYEQHGNGPTPQPARYSRTSPVGVLRLCGQHLAAWREDDHGHSTRGPSA